MNFEDMLRVKLEVLKREHRDLDEAISALELSGRPDQLTLRRLKKQKLSLKDQIVKRLICGGKPLKSIENAVWYPSGLRLACVWHPSRHLARLLARPLASALPPAPPRYIAALSPDGGARMAVDVGIIMGSQSDWPTMKEAALILDQLG
eukprot:gene15571-19036_t